MEKSSFFNSVSHDRTYKAEDWAEYFESFIGNGIFPDPADGLQVTPGSGMKLTVKAGRAWINGYFYRNTDDLSLQLENANGALKRIDRVVLRLNLTERAIRIAVKSSELASSPTPPPLQRDADIYELPLADVTINAGVSQIQAANISDLREATSMTVQTIFKSSTSSSPGTSGLVPAPKAGQDSDYFLTADGEWSQLLICARTEPGDGLMVQRNLSGKYELKVRTSGEAAGATCPVTLDGDKNLVVSIQEELATGISLNSGDMSSVINMNCRAIRTGNVIEVWNFGQMPIEQSLAGNDLTIYVNGLGAYIDPDVLYMTAGRAYLYFTHRGVAMPITGSPFCDLRITRGAGGKIEVTFMGDYSFNPVPDDDGYQCIISMYFSFPVKKE